MHEPKPSLLNYLGGVHGDDPARPEDKAVGIPHSDRHQPLHAHLSQAAGESSPVFRQVLRDALAAESHRAPALAAVTTLLAQAGIASLILKGAALSYTVYPAPHLRPRNDDDLWVREADFEKACLTLEAAGYIPELEVTARDITRQRHFSGRRGFLSHQVDLHWWPVNPSSFDDLPAFDECLRRSVPLPLLGEHACAPDVPDAVVLACAHRVAHHTATEDAVWMCDLHFLILTLDERGWAEVAARARAARVARITGIELQRIRDLLGSAVPADVLESLLAVSGEPSARHLRRLGPLGDLWLALAGERSTRSRARILRQHLLPPRSYMARRYGYNGAVVLPMLYAFRAVNGLSRWTAQYLARRTR